MLSPGAFRLLQGLLAAALLHAAATTVAYAFQTYPRHRVESAWIVFAALAIAGALVQWRVIRAGEGIQIDRRVLPIALGGAALLYAPSLGVGLLSDDFPLVAAATRWDITPAWEHFRPAALALWALVGLLSSDPALLHGVNIALHGLNVFLVYWLALEMGESRAAATAAGALFLVFPGAVEAVTWLSGVQDVLMTSLVLGMLVAAVRQQSVMAFGLFVLATLSKETAVCAPVLLILLRTRRPIAARFIRAAFAWSLAFGVARLYLKPAEGLLEPVGGYFIKQFVAGLFGTLAFPWTRAQMFQSPWLMLVIVATLVTIALALVRSRERAMWTNAALWAAFALVAALPVYRFFHITPDLQGSRYLYLPSGGWSILLAATASRWPKALGNVTLAFLIVAGVFGTLVQQQRWRAAASYRDDVLQRALVKAASMDCPNPDVRNGPDAHDGIYVFRNGIREASAARGISNPSIPPDCALQWRDEDFIEIAK